MYDRHPRKENDYSRAVANEVSNKTNQVNDFVDNSPEAKEAQLLQKIANNSSQSIETQQSQDNTDPAQKEDKADLPDHLKAIIENLSLPTDDENSSEPPQVNPLLDRLELFYKDREKKADDKEKKEFGSFTSFAQLE